MYPTKCMVWARRNRLQQHCARAKIRRSFTKKMDFSIRHLQIPLYQWSISVLRLYPSIEKFPICNSDIYNPNRNTWNKWRRGRPRHQSLKNRNHELLGGNQRPSWEVWHRPRTFHHSMAVWIPVLVAELQSEGANFFVEGNKSADFFN